MNAPLIHRACSRVPFSLLKYAMTLDGNFFQHYVTRIDGKHKVMFFLFFFVY